MTQTIRWGILGCGRIARKFAADLSYVPESKLVAIGSRSLSNAESFATEFPVSYIHGSYEELAQNPEVDIVYIATPHNLHYENTLLCLDHGKAVLCEKPFAMNSVQAREMIRTAREKNLFLMEALWTKFLPHYKKAIEIAQSGELGSIKSILVNFGFRPAEPIPRRLYDPVLGGGTIMDIGIYNAFITLSFLGKPDSIQASMTPAPTGVDEQCAVLFKYANGALAQLFSTFKSDLATEADICGDKARMRLTTRFYEPSATIELYAGKTDSRIIVPVDKSPGAGYQYEAIHAAGCLRNNIKESPVMTHDDTLLLMETLDAIRQIAGIKYDADGNA